MTNVFLLTQNDVLMPATYVGLTDDGLCEVTSPNGTAYTANPTSVYSAEAGSQMLRQRRAEQLVSEGYQIQHLRGNRYHVWCPKRHGETGGYVVTIDDLGAFCNCPDTERVGCGNCKHALGAEHLLRYAQTMKPVVRMAAVLVVAERVNSRLTEILAKRAAMIARDGWGA